MGKSWKTLHFFFFNVNYYWVERIENRNDIKILSLFYNYIHMNGPRSTKLINSLDTLENLSFITTGRTTCSKLKDMINILLPRNAHKSFLKQENVNPVIISIVFNLKRKFVTLFFLFFITLSIILEWGEGGKILFTQNVI